MEEKSNLRNKPLFVLVSYVGSGTGHKKHYTTYVTLLPINKMVMDYMLA